MSDFDRQKWNNRHGEAPDDPGEPESALVEMIDLLPTAGKALDVAGGRGRHALWLAARGLDVTLSDISTVALEKASAEAARRGLRIDAVECDFETDPLPAGPWDVIYGSYFLERRLFPQFPSALAPGGLLIYVQPTLTNLERHAKPPADFLLRPGELATLMEGEDLEVLQLDEAWRENGRHEARLVARRPQESG